MLTFVGLGLYDERSVTVEGREAIAAADRVVAEFYTSRLVGATVGDFEAYHAVEVEVRERAGVEGAPDFVDDAADGDVVFLTAGDPMMSTTHVDLRLRAHERGIETRVVHGVTAATAAAGLTGLQNYRFGKATTLPFEDVYGGRGSRRDARARRSSETSDGRDRVPASVVDTVEGNLARDLHTLVYLDIKVGDRAGDREGAVPGEDGDFMRADHAAGLLAEPLGDLLGVAVARAGSPDPVVAADRLSALAGRSFGGPLHLLVVPAAPDGLEADALAAFGGAPEELL
jgi:diphthine synthase